MPKPNAMAVQKAASENLKSRLLNLYLTGREFQLTSGDVVTLKSPSQKRHLQAMFAAREKHPEAFDTAFPSGAQEDGDGVFDATAATTPEQQARALAMVTVGMASAIELFRACSPTMECDDVTVHLAEWDDATLEALIEMNGGSNGELYAACAEAAGGHFVIPGEESDPLD